MIPRQKSGCIVVSKEDPNNILVIRTTYGDFTYLSFPKGHLENGETLEECATREVSEETGLNVKLVKELGVCVHPDYYCNELGEILFYIADSLSDDIDNKLKNDSATDVLWINYRDVLNIGLAEDYKNFYCKYFTDVDNYIKSKQS